MKKCIPSIIMIHFIECLLIYSFVLLNAQVGWGPDTRLTFDYAYNADPKAVCCDDTIHLVWWKNYLDSLSIFHDEIFYKRSTDAGLTWEADVLLSTEDTQGSTMPQITISSGVVHVVWAEDDYGLLYRRSTDGGTTWQQIDSIVPGMSYSAIQAFSDTIYVCGIIGTTGNLRFMKSVDGGSTWILPINVTLASANPSLSCTSENILNIIISYRGFPNIEVYNVRSVSGGESWLDSQMVSENDGIGSQHPAMDIDDSGGIHITWYDYKYSSYPWTGDIFYRASRDSGTTWEPIDSLTVLHRAVASDILAEGSNLHLVWEDDRNDFGNNFEIYYRMSTDLGQTWQLEERLTNAPHHSYRPAFAFGGGFLHLFWCDLRDYGNNQPWMLYHKRKNPVGIDEVLLARSLPSRLSLNCPTMLKKGTLIHYDLGRYSEGVIMIIDVTGRIVATYPMYDISGVFALTFNKEVQNGVYFIMLKTGEEYVTKKVVKVE